MPGRLELVLASERLPEPMIPDTEGVKSYGDPVKCSVQNVGTTTISEIEISIRGAGAENVRIGFGRYPLDTTLRLDDKLAPGQSSQIWVRSMFSASDDEDARRFELVASAKSIG